MPDRGPITSLLQRSQRGDAAALNALMPLIYDELRAIAARLMRSERPGHTLQATALVHEAYDRLLGGSHGFANRAHFFAAAACAVRRILVDHARARARREEAGVARAEGVEVDDLAEGLPDRRVLAVDAALRRLAEHHPTQARLVELRFFGGLSTEEAAEALGLAPRTAARDWAVTRAWLSRELREELDLDG